jgi:trk system potassium uptake protein
LNKKYAVIGLGYFGAHLAKELTNMGAEVLAIDDDMRKLEEIKELVTHTIKADSTEKSAMKNLGLNEYDAVILCMGDNFEANLLSIAVLQELEVNRIIVRATTPVHEKILIHLGIKEIILPAIEAADRLAHSLFMKKVVESFSLSSDYSIIESPTPKNFIGKNLIELNLPQNFGISLITIKRMETKHGVLGIGKKSIDNIIGIPSGDTVIEPNDMLVLFGTQERLNKIVPES